MLIYKFTPDAPHYYVATEEAIESPLEPGIFLIPAGATDIAVNAESEGYHRIWNPELTRWEYEAIPATPDPLIALAAAARAKRNILLAESDWTQVADMNSVDAEGVAVLSPAKIVEWKTYRQALRDVPEQEDFPDPITWPTKPVGRV